ncbi:ureide permease 1-like [Dioscorea cayenensis subsp. rotundata]|uniref:Ureide permease 1-like n=1 Tax=Dioscorea cayennensis subsp. rotundata TaxID=55577 RepID=A0AB40AQK3_DIOCR|nr:ureide permease 1-like [Dioscorea cayenensis subsp. rotundata]XP_039116971.1 ureide permease 1-like [Dioscorea cayenensis subsp. rotundata]
MFVIEDKLGAIALMQVSLLLLGTWPAFLTLLEQRGRLPQHTYLDYSLTNFFAAVFIALTFGQLGDAKPNFFTQLSQDNWPSVLFAVAGGIMLSLGNLVTQYALAFVGLSVTLVITASLTVVIGTTMNYFLDNRINRAEILFPGVACFLVAVCLGAAVHSSNAADNAQKLGGFSSQHKDQSSPDMEQIHLLRDTPGYNDQESNKDAESGISYTPDDVLKAEKVEPGSAKFLLQLEHRRSIKVLGSDIFLGLSMAFFAGICFSLFSPAFNLATNDQWHTLKEGVPHLVVYTAFFYFSISCFVLATILNIYFLYNPMLGLPKSSFTAYLKDCKGRHWALLAGLICGFGNGFQFMSGQAAGYAAADSVQALPLVSTFWGVVLFGEYRKSSKKTYILLASMLFMFAVAVAVLMASSGQRKTSFNS